MRSEASLCCRQFFSFCLLFIFPPAPLVSISVMVTANLNTPLMVGQTGNILTCDAYVSGADNLNPTITYQWTRNGETVPDGNPRTLDLSPLQLSHAGNYTCRATISSSLLNNNITATSDNNQNLTIQSESMNLPV